MTEQHASKPLHDARIVLASASPRRSMLLETLGLKFTVDPSTAPEVIPPDAAPHEAVTLLAAQKAEDVAERHPGVDLVIGADTIVVLDGAILGKPADRADALRMLGLIAGRWHAVYTGFAVIMAGTTHVSYERSEVRIAALDEAQIARYVDTGEPLDKAGSYAIQGLGSTLVPEIRGCYTNIVGLPIPALIGKLGELGWHAW